MNFEKEIQIPELYLDDDEKRALHDFEEDCSDELTRRQRMQRLECGEERWTKAILQFVP